jgi:Rad3-related DNA helicase
VVLLDRRVVTRRYGARVLDGLPQADRLIGEWEEIRDACEEFFARHDIAVAPIGPTSTQAGT